MATSSQAPSPTPHLKIEFNHQDKFYEIHNALQFVYCSSWALSVDQKMPGLLSAKRKAEYKKADKKATKLARNKFKNMPPTLITDVMEIFTAIHIERCLGRPGDWYDGIGELNDEGKPVAEYKESALNNFNITLKPLPKEQA